MLRLRFLLLSLCLSLACLWIFQPVAHADGGAPNLAYIAGSSAGISIIDIARQRVTRTFSLSSSPSMILLNADGSLLFAAQPEANRVQVLDAATGKTRCQASVPGQPSLLVLSPQEDAFFVAGNGDNHIREFAPTTCQLLGTITTPTPVYGMASALDGGVFPTHIGLYQLCVSTANQVLVFDPDGKQLASYSVPAGPRYLSVPPIAFTVYVTTRQGSVVAIDLKTGQVTPPLLKGGSFGPMDFDEMTLEVYVPDALRKQVDVISYQSGQNPQSQIARQPLRTFAMEATPVTVAITSDGQLGFVALQDGHVVMLDLPGRQRMQTFSVGGTPRFIITGVYPPTPLPTPQQQAAAQQPETPTSNGLLPLLLTIFALALVGLIVVLTLLWRQQRH